MKTQKYSKNNVQYVMIPLNQKTILHNICVQENMNFTKNAWLNGYKCHIIKERHVLTANKSHKIKLKPFYE